MRLFINCFLSFSGLGRQQWQVKTVQGSASLAPLQPTSPLRTRRCRGDLRARGPSKTQAMVRFFHLGLVGFVAVDIVAA